MAIPDAAIPRAQVALLQHALDTYASETNKVESVWALFTGADLDYRPHPAPAQLPISCAISC